MFVQVGSQVRFNDEVESYVCTDISEWDTIQQARDSSDDWTPEARSRVVNVKYISINVEPYKVGDVIRIKEHRIRFERQGNIRFIVIRKEVTKINGPTNVETTSKPEATSTEGVREGSARGPSLGIESIGEDDRPEDGIG